MTEQANYSCPGCGDSDLTASTRKIFECQSCGMQVHEAVADASDSLARLADRDDTAGELATKLIETGGVTE